ncbi:MAG: trypsin-like peptidase domain-containing protein [Acidimicrobiia bacterium]|nr:trypsin-like peptidase domain-containing protein [Acidimicrobiia bacterium]
MGRAWLVAAVLGLSSPAAQAQGLGTLRITVTLTDATGAATPVGRHALLISEEPPGAPPRRIFTTAAGTADVSLRPGRYAVESDQPLAFEDKTYEWSQRVDIVAGRHATIDFTADNASVETRASTAGPAGRSATDPSLLAARWQGSVVALWTPTQHASGFVADARGLIVTSQRVVGTATSAEAQFTPDLKVRATVLASDATRDVAILWVNPSVVAAVQPLAPGCGRMSPPLANGHELYAIGALMTGQKRLTLGQVTGVGPRLLLSDLTVNRASAGGPVFGADGLIGFTTVDDRDPDGRSNARVVRIDQACEALASVEGKMAGAMPPDATPLPVEPRRPIPVGTLAEAVKTRTGNLTPYAMSTSGFEIAFITPVHVYGANDQVRRPVMEFGNWSEYLADYPRVLLVRVTPKMVEGLWARVARGAAMTQGIALPPITRAKAGFSRMRALCGEAEVTPIHPFLVEQRLSATDAIYEGLYVFDPAALGPQCGTVKLTIYSEQDPGRGDTRVVDPRVLQQVASDFAPL